MANNSNSAILLAGIPAVNRTLYHRIRFLVGDPVAFVDVPTAEGRKSTLILRDIEMHRAGQSARADRVACPADFKPAGGLSGDRETATAQAAAECLRRAGIGRVIADRTLPFIYADILAEAGIEVRCDREMGVLERRQKDSQEIEQLREAQAATEGAMRMACELVAGANCDAKGVLQWEGAALTSARLRSAIDVWLLARGYTNPASIVACGPQGADCHQHGSGEIVTGQPVIIDIFPQNRNTLYNGDCTRTVVHGEIPKELVNMHTAVTAAKKVAEEATRPGATGEEVHKATIETIRQHGYEVGLPSESAPLSYCGMVHGTGHGVGLDVHEPPLLDFGGPPLLIGDALTIEPGLYRRDLGGVRVEDMVVVTQSGCENLNQLPEGLSWK